MALIDIDVDDRDTINYFGGPQGPVMAKEISEKFKEWLVRLESEVPTGSTVEHLGTGRYKIVLPVITCSGSDITTIINIPFMHQIQKMEFKHTDSSNDDSIDAFDYSVSHRYPPTMWLLLLNIVDSVASDIIDEYIDYYMSRGEYRLVTNSTNTNKVFANLYIRITGE